MNPYLGSINDLPHRIQIRYGRVLDDTLSTMVDWLHEYPGYGEWDCTVQNESWQDVERRMYENKVYVFCFTHEEDAMVFKLRFADKLAK